LPYLDNFLPHFKHNPNPFEQKNGKTLFTQESERLFLKRQLSGELRVNVLRPRSLPREGGTFKNVAVLFNQP
jgi:hypothetical protein